MRYPHLFCLSQYLMRGISQLDTSSSSSGGLHSHGRLDTACPSPARAVPVQEEDIYLYGAYTNNQGRSGGIAPISSCLIGSHRGFHPTASTLVPAGLHNQPVTSSSSSGGCPLMVGPMLHIRRQPVQCHLGGRPLPILWSLYE